MVFCNWLGRKAGGSSATGLDGGAGGSCATGLDGGAGGFCATGLDGGAGGSCATGLDVGAGGSTAGSDGWAECDTGGLWVTIADSDWGVRETWDGSSTQIILPSGFGSKRKKDIRNPTYHVCACIQVMAEPYCIPLVLGFLGFLVFNESVAFSFPLDRFATFLPLFSFPFALLLLAFSAPAKVEQSREL